jgi:L-amino acid N-acyltransferase YncA
MERRERTGTRAVERARGDGIAPARAPVTTVRDLAPEAIRVRPASARDAGGIAAIWNREALGALTTTDTEPRSVVAQRRWLAAHAAEYPVIVATDGDERLAGFAALTAYRSKPAFRHTVEDSIYVERAWRGSGVGRLLLRELLRLADAHGHRSVIARITTENVGSRRLHESFGFRLVGIEEAVAFKLGRWLDVAVYQRLL